MKEQGHARPGASAEEAALLETGTVASLRLVAYGSNYTFLAVLEGEGGARANAIYKPSLGETPLWDFLDGTLYRRERAAYLLAELLGWNFVPLTVVREGPHGVGSMQAFVDHDPREHYFTLGETHAGELRRICLFDWLANNADRKAGHVLVDRDRRLWGIDHGLTFHAQHKLRTVIWDFAGQPVPPALLQDLRGLQGRLSARDDLAVGLRDMLHPREIEALARRLVEILADPTFPHPSTSRRPVPWPWL